MISSPLFHIYKIKPKKSRACFIMALFSGEIWRPVICRYYDALVRSLTGLVGDYKPVSCPRLINCFFPRSTSRETHNPSRIMELTGNYTPNISMKRR